MIHPLWKTVWKFLKKLEIKPTYDPEIPLLSIYPEETKIERDTCIPLFIAALFTIVPKNYICTAFSVKNFSLKMCFFKSNSKQLMKHKSMESFKSQCKFGFIKDHLPET